MNRGTYIYDRVANELVTREEFKRREEQRSPSKRGAIEVHNSERGTWAFLNGKLVPAHLARRSRDFTKARSDLPSPQVMRDIEPFQNVAVDGKEIGSRSHKREMMKRHGLVEMGTEKRVTQRVKPPKGRVREAIRKSMQQLGAPL